MSAFELVSLARSSACAENPESSDDGLDPYEFISTPEPPSPFPALHDPDTRLTEHVSASRVSDSLASLFLTDSLSPPSGPLLQLQAENGALKKKLRHTVTHHNALLRAGANCAASRRLVSRLLTRLSENNLQLHDAYASELESTTRFARKVLRWDALRAALLAKIRLIKSDDNAYGSKLRALLGERDAVDAEMRALEERVAVLAAKRHALGAEISETTSVLDSKAARYVSLFRKLERQGADALGARLSEPLLSAVAVDSGFVYLEPQEETTTQPEGRWVKRRHERPDEQTRDTETPVAPLMPRAVPAVCRPVEPINTPGMVPYEPAAQDAEKQDASPYEKGYTTGAKQIAHVKEGLAAYLARIFPPPTTVPCSALDDEQNRITEMIDLKPVTHFFQSKAETLEAFLVRTSRLSEMYHNDAVEWDAIAVFLDTQEDKVYDTLSASQDHERVFGLVKELFEFLLKHAQARSSVPAHDPDASWFLACVKSECLATAAALETLLGDSGYVSQLDFLDAVSAEAPPLLNQYLLDSRITSTGYNGDAVQTLDASLTVDAMRKQKKSKGYRRVEKAVKKD